VRQSVAQFVGGLPDPVRVAEQRPGDEHRVGLSVGTMPSACSASVINPTAAVWISTSLRMRAEKGT
jgi:hypothetical protein